MSLAATFLPDGKTPQWVQIGALAPAGQWTEADDRPVFRPSTQEAGFYVLGHDGRRWIDVLGIAMLLGVLLGVTIHGGLRVRHFLTRRTPATAEEKTTEGEPA